MGALGQATFTHAVCSCTTLNTSAIFNTDGFNSTLGGPDGGPGGSVGSDQSQSWSNKFTVGGDLAIPGNISESAVGTVRGNLFLGGTASASATLTIDGNASVVKTLPSNVKVVGTTTKVSSVSNPCDCTNLIPVASIVAAHRSPANDDATIGLSATAATGSNAVRIDLPCGNYYLSQINMSAPLTIWAHGHTALYIDGNVNASSTIAFNVDPTATLDLFVSGTFNASNSLTLGSTSAPAHCRAYFAGPSIDLSGSSTIGCNIYAPAAAFNTSAAPTIYGSLFVDSLSASANTTIHYDQAIQSAGGECCTPAKCDDGNPCTVDTCNGDGTCSHTPATNGTTCSGSNLCEKTYTCQAGVCTGSNPVVCTAEDECHVAGTCNPATGVCSNPTATNGTACNDGNACDLNDSCQAGTCTAGSHVTCTAEDQCHTAGACNPSTGLCANPAAANGTSCNDGNACDLNDSCQAGVCTAGSHVTCTSSDQCHTAGTCNPSTGQCSNPAATNGTACNDGNACDLNDSCQSGVCTAGSHVTCTAEDQCHTAGTCNPSTGQCSNPAAVNGTGCNDGNACDLNDSCQAGVCTAGSHVTCTAEDQCHTAGTCNRSTGQCSNPAAANGTTCSDGNACDLNDSCQAGVCTAGSHVTCTAEDQCHTAGTCNPSTGQCSNPAATNGTACNDGNACDLNDSCQAGVCTAGSHVTCAASDQCHTAGTCNSSTGQCSNPAATNGTACSDGNACDLNDSCQAGVCTAGSHVTCTAEDQCHTAGACNASTGQCSNPAATNGTSCNDGNACDLNDSCQAGVCTAGSHVTCTASDQCHTAGACNPSTGQCSNPAATNGTACNDGNACDLNDSCQAGVCTAGSHVTCTASDQCHTAGTCSPSTGACSNSTQADGTACTGSNKCDQNYACAAGVCTGSNPVTCTASDQCHVAGTCDPASGTCSNPAATNGATCNDGNACTQTDSCQSGTCTGSNPVTCTASDSCHLAGTCDPTSGCSNPAASDGTACTGTDHCFQSYACATGTCTGSNPVTCTASDQCHAAGTCDPTSGSCSNPAATNGTRCNDGNACTQSDSCQSGTCTGSNPVACTATDQCHGAGTCNPATGACSNPNAPDGTTCGTADGGQPLICTAGACGAEATCTSSQTLCSGVCVSTQSDPGNCGSCGNRCASGFSCAAGTCASPGVMASCSPSNGLSVLPGAGNVSAYVPNGAWGGAFSSFTGLWRVVVEGPGVSEAISTPDVVNSCATNWVTGEVVCVSNGTDVYIINGSTITAILTSGATAQEAFSGGFCQTCGVVIDAAANKAILSVGLTPPPGVFGGYMGGYQFLDLATNTLSPPIPVGTTTPVNGQTMMTSEDIAVDPFRHLVLSPNELSDYQLVQYAASPAVYDNPFPTQGGVVAGSEVHNSFDSAAEDCSTGIALATDESNVAGSLTLLDLTQAVFTPGSPKGTWTAPTSATNFLALLSIPGNTPAAALEMTGLAVAPGSHLGLVTSEFTFGVNIAVFRLPSSSGSGTPALVDWAGLQIATGPVGPWGFSGFDPHTVSAYTSPLTGRAMGLITNGVYPLGDGSPSVLGLIDLQAILDAPRLSGSNDLDPSYDLVAHGVVSFTQLPCTGVNIVTDPFNCGGCGHVCPSGPHSEATCSFEACGLHCDAGFADCNQIPTDGCEVNLAYDPANCGACGTNCAAPNATGVCDAGQCGLVCNVGFSNCDGIQSNGCETAGPCIAPSVSFSGPTSVVVGDPTPTYVATATGAPGRTLSYAWTALSGPGVVTFASPAALTTTAEFFAAGTYVIQFEANDGYTTTAANLTVTAILVNKAPVVTVGANQTLTQSGSTVSTTLTGSATDDGLPVGATLSSTWSVVSGPVAVTIATPTQSGVAEPGPITASTLVTFAYPGTYVFELDVSDTDLVGTATTTVTVNPPAGTAASPPTVAIGGVTDDQEVTKITPILGTVSDGAWVLERRLGGRDDVSTAWTVMASGTGAVSGTQIATFDPTLLLNGIYTLQLLATNNAGTSSASVSLSVDGRMKVGNFTLTFTDLSTVVGNLPLSVTRTYDSRDKTIGDFGYGWKLGISDVRVEKSGKTGAYWYIQTIDQGILTDYCLYPLQAASVAITFPSGRQYRFVPQASPQCAIGSFDTTPDMTWVSTSDPNNPTIKLVAAGGSSVFAADVGVIQLQDLNTSDIWDPRQFTLTIEDGSVWQIDQDLGVTSIKDLNGNTLTITPGGILHSSGKQVTFARDPKGRITKITDPAGQAMTYAYDANGDLATYTDRSANVTQFAYAANHYLDQIQDPLGRLPIRNTYDSNNRLISTTDATGATVHYTPNLASNQEQVTDRLGHVTLYVYNDRGDVTQKTDTTGAVWNYTFDQYGNVLTSTDPLGHTKTTVYDGAFSPLKQTDALGNVTTNTYDYYRQPLTTTDPLGHVTTSTYDASGNLASVTDALGNATRYTYDSQGNRVSETDALRNITTSQYDAAGHVTQMTDKLGNIATYTYDANGNRTTQTVSRTQYNGSGFSPVTTYTYDASGRVTQTAVSNAGSRSTTYTATGKRATTTDELGRVTGYTYDALDRLVTTTHPDGSTETQTYDAENRRTSSTDAAGNTTSYQYDAVGRLARTTYADGSSASTTYDAAGNAVEMVDELGHVHWSAYDADNRLTSATDPTGATTQTQYDPAGNRAASIDALGHETSFAYDAMNRVVATTYPDGAAESTLYDALGRAVARNDALGRTTSYGYDAMGRLVSVTDALGQVTQYTFNGLGERTSQRDANGHRTIFKLDSYTGRDVGRILPDNSQNTLTYDLAGQLVTRVDFNGQATAYTYDPMGRVLSRSYPDSSVVSFTYTPDGRRATATDARGTTTYGYDSRRRVVQATYPDGRVLQYGYDAHGDRTSLTARIGSTALTTTTSYDADERPAGVTDPLGRVFTLGYDPDGDQISMQYPNSTSTSYTYDARSRLTNSTTVDGASTVASFAYTLDLAGRRTQETDADGTVRGYGYDGIDRLTSETVAGSLSYAKVFAYDAVGNRLTQTTTGTGAASVTYAYDSRDRLSAENSTSYGYDANGNLTSKSGEASYGWDFENRLTNATMTAGATVAHQYDADGNRVQTVVTPSGGSAATTNMLVDTAGCASCGGGGGLSQVVAETDGSGNVTAVYVRAGDELLEVMRPAGGGGGTWTTRFVHHDGLGSVRALTDETGTTTDTRGYEAFGTKNTEAGNDPLTYGFAGEPFQADSMLAYHRARWMDARVGRFAGMDRAEGDNQRPMTLHRYIYGSNQPTIMVDPSGNDDDGVDSEPNYAIASGFAIPGVLGGNPVFAPPGSPAATASDVAAINVLTAIASQSQGEKAEYAGWIYFARSVANPIYHASAPVRLYRNDPVNNPNNLDPEVYGSPGPEPDLGLYVVVALYHTHPTCLLNHVNEDFDIYDKMEFEKYSVNGYLDTPSNAIRKYWLIDGSQTTLPGYEGTGDCQPK